MKQALAMLSIIAMLVLGLGGVAGAGEYSGKGKAVPGGEKGKSECSYSGQDISDDIEMNPEGFDDDHLLPRGVQSYGQFVSQGLKAFVPSPGVACRGNSPGGP